MNYSRSIILSMIILTCSAMINAQNEKWGPEPRLVDDFKFSTQGYVKMLLDSFFIDLTNNPNDRGYVIVYPKSESQRRAIEKIIRSQIKVRKFDASRIEFAKGTINSDGIVQFWLIPPGSLAPLPRDPSANPYGTGTGRGSGSSGVGSGPGTAGAKTEKPLGNVDAKKADRPLRIISKPRAAYTELARRNQTTGTVELKITFLSDGTIGEIIPVVSLPDGLTEQAMKAARGIRFEPELKRGVAVTVSKVMTFSFAIY